MHAFLRTVPDTNAWDICDEHGDVTVTCTNGDDHYVVWNALAGRWESGEL